MKTTHVVAAVIVRSSPDGSRQVFATTWCGYGKTCLKGRVCLVWG